MEHNWRCGTARGRMRIPGTMNKTEERYASELDLMLKAGMILWYRFEGCKLRLADKTFYTPDFVVMLADNQLEMHEVKGHWEDDSRVKIKVAAAEYPFIFRAFSVRPKRDGGGWKEEAF